MKVTAIKTFGRRLTEAMKEVKVSQAELGRHFEITPQAINQWTKAKIPPELTLDRWVSLSHKLNINLEWLCFGIGQRGRADMDERTFDLMRRFQQLDTGQQEVISTTINSLLSQKTAANFAEGKRR